MAGVRILRERRRHVLRVAAGYAVVGWLLGSRSIPITPVIFKLDPDFDSLRGDPAFATLPVAPTTELSAKPSGTTT
jgi:hypothetical protein